MRWRAQTATIENGFVHLPEAAIGAPKSAPFESDKAAKQTKCSIYVMAGLVPAIHVAGTQILQLYCHDFVKRHGKMAGNPLYF